MISVYDTDIEDIKIISPPAIFEDYRGVYRELFNEFDYSPLVGHMKLRGASPGMWWADDISISRKDVLRGIHGDYKTWKLVSCLRGAFYLVVVDWREDSPTYKNWTSITLSDRNYLSVLIPPGCGNGHLVLTEEAIFHYKQSEPYDRDGQFTIAWDDPELDIHWPLSTLFPILSKRDGGDDSDSLILGEIEPSVEETAEDETIILDPTISKGEFFSDN